ncbi:MAG: hypothetical protein LH606_21685 [Cytophagaceae bacterium]|nr:hypothetical protein [Cytophagaceae bacterium]
MKTLVLSLALLGSSLLVYASDDKFVKAMETTLDKMKNAKSVDDMQAAANQLERIAAAEPKEWLAPYWGSFAYAMMAWMSQGQGDKMDGYLEKAEALLANAEKAGGSTDETAVLSAYIAQARMMVDPQSRWQTYGPKVQEGIAKAKQLNPANPRPYFLEGQSLLYTPEQFGGGKAKACPVLQEASEKFATFKPASSIHPNWDEDRLKTLLAECVK